MSQSLVAVGNPEIDALLRELVAAKLQPEAPPPPLPAPLVRARPAMTVELARCNSARLAAAAGTAGGWEVEVTYSLGPYIGASGEPLEEDCEALVLQAVRGSELLRAMWTCRPSQTAPHKKTQVLTEQWVMECAFALLPRPFVRLDGNSLRPYLKETDERLAA